MDVGPPPLGLSDLGLGPRLMLYVETKKYFSASLRAVKDGVAIHALHLIKNHFPTSLRAAEGRVAIHAFMPHHQNALFRLDCFPRCARGRNDAVKGFRENKKQRVNSNFKWH